MNTPLELILSRLSKTQKHGDGYTATCPAHDDKSPSLSLSLGDDGRVLIHCHAGCKTEDVLSAIGLEKRDLFPSDISREQPRSAQPSRPAKEPEWVPELPISDEAMRTAPLRHPKHGAQPKVWFYRDANGAPLMMIYRFDLGQDDSGTLRKVFAPLTWCQNTKTGQHEWCWKSLPKPRPLLNLNKLAAQPTAPVVISEGEKAADAASMLLAEYVSTCWSHGAESWQKTDFSPLVGHHVLLWPDNDPVGIKTMNELAEHLGKIGVASVRIVDLRVFSQRPGLDGDRPTFSQGGEWSKGDDAADALAKGWTAAHFAELERIGQLSIEVAGNDQNSEACSGKLSGSSLWRAVATPASSIAPASIRWLWPSWIAKGKLTVLAGAGGSGKTTLALSLIGTLTSGGNWPDGKKCDGPGNALIWSSEDDPADTLIPRLKAAGADLDRVRIIEGRINSQGEREPFDPATDFDLLYDTAESMGGVSLVLLDPIVSAVKGDMHRANDVRRALQQEVDFAKATGCAVLGISHFSKNTKGALPADRVIGSQAFSALARTVLVAAKQDNSATRVLARAKSNISDDQDGIGYTMENYAMEDGLEAIRVVWGECIEGSASDILADVEGSSDEEPGALKNAESFLISLLSAGPVSVKQIKADAEGAGHAWKTVERAKKSLGVESYKEGMKGPWFWRLGTEDRQESTKAATKNSDGLQERMAAFDESDSEVF